jgi:hypothetical protein
MNETIECLTTIKAANCNEMDANLRRTLPSGRSVVIKVAGDQEALEVRSPNGEVEVRVTLTAEGAVVNLQAARLELDSPDSVAVNCRRFTVNSTEGTELSSGGELRIKTEGDIHLNGGIIRLNC